MTTLDTHAVDAALAPWTWRERLAATPDQERAHLLARLAYAAEVTAALPLDVDPSVSVGAVSHQIRIQDRWADLDTPAAVAARLGLDQHSETRHESDVYHRWFSGGEMDAALVLAAVVASPAETSGRTA